MITGTIGAANALVASIVPRERSGFAMGLLQVGLGVGVGLGPIIGGAVADAFGYRAAFYVTGALLAVAGIIVAIGVQEYFVPPAKTDNRRSGFWRKWPHILSAPGVVVTYALRFMDSLSRMAFIPILPLFALELMAEASRVNSFTGLVIGAASAAAAVFSVFFGRIGDRTGHRRIVLACALAGFLSFLLQAWVGSGWQFLSLHLLAGIAHGGIATGVSALLAVPAMRRGGRGLRSGQLRQLRCTGPGADDRRLHRHVAGAARGVCGDFSPLSHRRRAGTLGVAAGCDLRAPLRETEP